MARFQVAPSLRKQERLSPLSNDAGDPSLQIAPPDAPQQDGAMPPPAPQLPGGAAAAPPMQPPAPPAPPPQAPPAMAAPAPVPAPKPAPVSQDLPQPQPAADLLQSDPAAAQDQNNTRNLFSRFGDKATQLEDIARRANYTPEQIHQSRQMAATQQPQDFTGPTKAQMMTGSQREAAQEPETKPSKLRRFLGGAAGVGVGILSKNPMLGLDTYKGISGAPEADRQRRFAQQADAIGDESKVLQEGSKVAQTLYDYNKLPIERQGVNNKAMELNQPKWITVPMADGRTGLTNEKDPQHKVVPLDGTGGKMYSRDGIQKLVPKTDLSALPDQIDENAMGHILSFAKPGADKVPSLERDIADDWIKKNPGKTLADFNEYNKKLVPETTFNLQNPGGGSDRVNYIVEQVENDPTGQIMNKLVGTDKTLRAQVANELAKRDSDLRVLTPATRSLGEAAHTLVPKFDGALKVLDDPKVAAALGVVGSRYQAWIAGKVGSSDPVFRGLDKDTITKLNELRTTVSLLQTGTARAHIGARGSASLQEKFEKLFNVDKMDAQTAKDSMTATRDFLKGYDKAVYKDNKGRGTGGGTHADKSDAELLDIISGKH